MEETYAFIESDLNEALKCQTPLVKDGVAKRWRANTAGINGFASRFYLNRNNYEKALEYANKALSEWNVLVDYNTEMSESDAYGFGVNFPSTFDLDASNYTKKLAWKESLYMRFLYTTYVDMLYFPSRDLTALYDTQHDLRYKYHFVEGFMEIYGSQYSYPVYMFFSFNHIPNGPSTAEMYLIKAECQARLGDFSTAMLTLNQLRAKRLTPGTWVNLQAGTQREAIKSIIDERRREMPFSQRWNDLRRYNNNEDPDDDVPLITRKFYPISSSAIYDKEAPIIYKLEKNSRKYALPINQNEINVSGGVIKQNAY
ncbi:SusD family protein [compost metagenome]